MMIHIKKAVRVRASGKMRTRTIMIEALYIVKINSFPTQVPRLPTSSST